MGLAIKFCVTLPHMSIRARIVVAIALKKIDHAPYAEASAQRHNQRLKRRNRRSENAIIDSSMCSSFGEIEKGRRYA